MKTNYKIVIGLVLFSFLIFALASNFYAQDEPKSELPKDVRPPRERFKEGIKKKESRLEKLLIGQEWIESVKKYKDEISALESELEPVRKEVRNLVGQLQRETDEVRKSEIKNKLEIASGKENEIDIKIAEKKKEFAGKNFQLALERMIEAEVEFREKEREVWLRQEFIRQIIKGERHFGKRGRAGGDDAPPRVIPPDEQPDGSSGKGQ